MLVKGTIPYDDLLEKIKKTGKEVRGVLSLWYRGRVPEEALCCVGSLWRDGRLISNT